MPKVTTNGARPAKMKHYKRGDVIAGFCFIAPPIIGFILFSLIPLCFSLVMSFNQYDFFTGDMIPVGFYYYAQAFTDPIFGRSLLNILIALAGLLVQIAITLGIAWLLCYDVKGQVLFRVLFFIPSMCSSVAVTMVWKWVYNTDFGILNDLLGLFGVGKVAWLTDQKIVMISMVLQGIWMGIGGGMVMYIAALKNAPSQYYEAAEIDGANSWQQFLHVTVPIISPTTFYILITSMIGTMQDFTRYRLMTDGGPNNASMTPVLYIYQIAFSAAYDYQYSYATTLSWLLGILIVALVGIQFKTSKWVHYND